MRPIVLTAALVLAGASVQAQSPPPTAFPESAASLTSDGLQTRLAGSVFRVKPSSGPDWRLEYKGDGYFFVNAGSFSDSGRWQAQDGKLCAEGRKIAAACNEVRATAEDLYLKRDNGEVVRLVKQ